ncbi:MAG TPA: hypothetical protein VM346_06015 [Sphingomicrobium sp.]|nr:hypothetical protein [Sphingomicrobium sp.]
MILALAAALVAAAPASHCPNVLTPQAFVCRGIEASNASRFEDSARAFEQAAAATAERDPAAARMWAAAGNMWIAAEQPGKAALALDRALAGVGLQAEQRGLALLDRARAAEAQNDLKTARTKVEEARQTIAADPFLWYFSAALAIREGDSETAKAAIGQALVLEPNDPTALFQAGHVYHFAGDEAQARAYWNRASAADPNGASGKAAREALTMLGQTATVQNPAGATR